MFGMLEAYKKQEFWEEHPVIRLTNSNGTSEYQIFAVYKTTADEGGFDYVSFREGETED